MGVNPLAELAVIRRLASLYREFQPDVVHHFTIKCVIYGSIAARLARIRGVVNSITGLGFALLADTPKARLIRPVVLSLYRFSLRGTQVVFQNADNRRTLEEHGVLNACAVHVVPGDGIDTVRFSPLSGAQHGNVVLMMARLLHSKGVDEFVDAARIVRRQMPTARFLLAGAPDLGNPESVDESTLSKWQAEGVVEFLGHRSDVVELNRAADVVVLASTQGEGIPRALLEGRSLWQPDGGNGCAGLPRCGFAWRNRISGAAFGRQITGRCRAEIAAGRLLASTNGRGGTFCGRTHLFGRLRDRANSRGLQARPATALIFVSTYMSFLPFLIAFFVTAASCLVLARLAGKMHLLDLPDERKRHAAAIPLVGGIGVMLGFGFSVAVWGGAGFFREAAGPVALLFVVGLLDDALNLRASLKLVVQIVAAAWMVKATGAALYAMPLPFLAGHLNLGMAAAPLTVLMMVAILNAINMIDGLDGLAGGCLAIGSLALAASANLIHQQGLSSDALLLVGAVCGFLIWNARFPWQPRAKIFLGDAGALAIGHDLVLVHPQAFPDHGHDGACPFDGGVGARCRAGG